MSQRLMFAAIVAVHTLASPTVRADDFDNVDKVIAKYIEAIGGRKALDAIKSIRATGKLTFNGGAMEAALSIESKRPKRFRMDFTLQGMTGTQAYDGETGWFVMPFMGKTDPEKMSAEQVELMSDQADMDGPLVDYKDKGYKVELIGKEEEEGSEVYKLKVTKEDGAVEYHYLDAEYFIPIKITGKRKMMGAEIEYEAAFGDYREVAGVLMVHSIENRGGPMGASTMVFDKIEPNVQLADSRFTMPEVKATPDADSETAKVSGKPKKADPTEKKASGSGG